MIQIKPPYKFKSAKVFLAGSIEQGLAEHWQEKVYRSLSESNILCVIYNPRRDDWDSSWTADSEELKNQIQWELENLKDSDIILFYFDPSTKSPISLLEFGKYIDNLSKKIIIVCPDGFYRKTNVVETAKFYKYDGSIFNTLDEGIDELKCELMKW